MVEIFLVDGNAEERKTTTQCLRASGHKVREFARPAELPYVTNGALTILVDRSNDDSDSELQRRPLTHTVMVTDECSKGNGSNKTRTVLWLRSRPIQPTDLLRLLADWEARWTPPSPGFGG